MIDSLVVVHVFYNQQSHMHNHYQPLRSKDGDTNVLSDSFLARYGKVHRPATRSLFDVLLPLCDARYCAVPTQIEQDGDNATPMRRESPFLHDVARLDEKLMNSPIIRSCWSSWHPPRHNAGAQAQTSACEKLLTAKAKRMSVGNQSWSFK